MLGDEQRKRVPVFWQGDSLDVLREFPSKVKNELGHEIERLQLGEKPLDSRPMKSIGQGVFELRQMDSNGWYRVIYLRKIAGRLFMLHSFVKKSAKTSQRDLNIAKSRLKELQAELNEEKKNAKKNR